MGVKVDELLLSKIFAVFLGFSALVLANININMLDLVFMTQSFYTPIVAVPFILAIFGFRIKKEVVYASMLSGFVSVLIWRKYFMGTGVDSVLPGILANLLTLISVQYCTNKKNILDMLA